jgi:rare lipoprotein A
VVRDRAASRLSPRLRSGAGAAAAVALAAAASAGCEAEVPLFPPASPPADAGPPPQDERVVEVLSGKAIWYGGKWHGRRTASGETFDKEAMTAAHRTIALGSRVRVTDLESGRSAVLRVNDRGPYGADRSRVMDVSEAAARQLGFHRRGWTRVKIEVLAPSPEE